MEKAALSGLDLLLRDADLGQRPRNQRKGKNRALKGRPQPEVGVDRDRVYFGKFVKEEAC